MIYRPKTCLPPGNAGGMSGIFTLWLDTVASFLSRFNLSLCFENYCWLAGTSLATSSMSSDLLLKINFNHKASDQCFRTLKL
jgi:hypothetical protein